MLALPQARGILTQDQEDLAPAFRQDDQQRQISIAVNLSHQNRTTAKGEESKVWKNNFFSEKSLLWGFFGKRDFLRKLAGITQ
jgi:hypothetical protein